ncbi:MAG: MaoC family dehydratase N-terminal domain-containing protein [Nitriliruptoraceae bacterium]
MALNSDRVGATYPSYTYEVSREKIREYATAVGETDARYFSDGDDLVAPPTFAACFTIQRGGGPILADPDLGGHSALVHGSQAYRFGDRPLRPGDVLVCTPRIVDITERGSNDFLTFEVDCRFADDDAVAVVSETTFVFLNDAPGATSSASGMLSGGAGSTSGRS